jgi:hypothetical protein
MCVVEIKNVMKTIPNFAGDRRRRHERPELKGSHQKARSINASISHKPFTSAPSIPLPARKKVCVFFE